MSKLNKYKGENDNNLGESFIEHLKNILKVNNHLKIDKIEAKVNKINNSESKTKINEEIISILNELREDFKDNDQNLGISNDDFNNNNITENDSDSEEEDDNNKENKIKNINPAFIIKYFYASHQEKKNELMPPISEETNKLLNYFRMNNKIKNKIKEEKEYNEKTLLNKKIIKILRDIKDNITKNFTFDIDAINNLIKEIANAIETLKTYNVIFIPFLGEVNSGKSTIINGIIGENILPTGLKECTKRGIIIRYTNNQTTIRKANFKSEIINNNSKYFFEAEDEDIIGSGTDQVRDILKGLNCDFNEKEEDSFYYIKTKIKLFDEMGLDHSLKKMIYLIDLPGFGTENIFQKKIYLKLMTICKAFIFIVRNSIIKEDNKKDILDKIFHQAKEQKEIFSSFLMKSSLFIFNNTKDQTFNEDDVQRAKNDIMELINVREKINLCFFNAKRYSLYVSNYNYYYNLGETLKNEYQNYLKDSRDIYLFPEIINSKKYDNFLKYLNNKLDEKNNKLFGTKKVENIKNDENVGKELRKLLELLNIDMESTLKYENKISQKFTFGREKIKQLNTKKESNYYIFSEMLKSQINKINNKMQEDIKIKINNTLKTLDSFFFNDFSKKKSKEDIDKFNEKNKEINKQLNSIFYNSQNNYFNIIQKYKEDIKESLEKKKENINQFLKEKKFENIIKEINKEIEDRLNELNSKILDLINNINSEINK